MPFNTGSSCEAHSQIGDPCSVAASDLPPVFPHQGMSGLRDPLTPPPVEARRPGKFEIIPAEFHSFRIGKRTFPFTDCAHVSAAYRATIERLGLGASETPPCFIYDLCGQRVGHISYNGRIWRGAHWIEGESPIYDPMAAEARHAA